MFVLVSQLGYESPFTSINRSFAPKNAPLTFSSEHNFHFTPVDRKDLVYRPTDRPNWFDWPIEQYTFVFNAITRSWIIHVDLTFPLDYFTTLLRWDNHFFSKWCKYFILKIEKSLGRRFSFKIFERQIGQRWWIYSSLVYQILNNRWQQLENLVLKPNEQV